MTTLTGRPCFALFSSQQQNNTITFRVTVTYQYKNYLIYEVKTKQYIYLQDFFDIGCAVSKVCV